MKAYSIPSGARTKSKSLYGTDGQMTKRVDGRADKDDTSGTGAIPKNPKALEHSLSLPSPPQPPGDSPSQTPSRPAGHPNVDSRPHPRMPQFALGGSPGDGRSTGALGRAKLILSERLAGRGASPGNHGVEGYPGGNRQLSPTYASRHGEATRQHSISLPSPTSRPGTPASLRHDVAPELKPDNRSPGGLNFPFGGGAQGGRGLDRRR